MPRAQGHLLSRWTYTLDISKCGAFCGSHRVLPRHILWPRVWAWAKVQWGLKIWVLGASWLESNFFKALEAPVEAAPLPSAEKAKPQRGKELTYGSGGPGPPGHIKVGTGAAEVDSSGL